MTILSNNYTYNHTFNNFLYDLTKNHDLLVTPNSIDNYTDIIETLDSNIRELALKTLQAKFESLDDDFFNSAQRKRNYRVKSKRSRTLLTVFSSDYLHQKNLSI